MSSPVISPLVSFDPAMFLARYPEFTTAYNANPALFASMFTEAGLYMNNSSLSPVQNPTKLSMFLNMITAHIAFLSGVLNADGQPKPVGRVTGAAQGSVNAQFDYPTPNPGSGEWFAQSQYGIAFWQATTGYRGMNYVAQPTRVGGFTGTPLGTQWIPPFGQ